MSSAHTPMLRQYRSIKGEYREHFLFFQVGDFYEMFFEDAKEASNLLELTLTKRNDVPMCGFPIRAARRYIELLLKEGKKVVLCDQSSNTGQDGKLMDRTVSEIITPGMIADPDFLVPSGSNYLGSLCLQQDTLCLSWVDISTGHLGAQISRPRVLHDQLRQDFERLNIREILCQESLYHEHPRIRQLLQERGMSMNLIPDWEFHLQRSFTKLCAHFATTNLHAFGLNAEDPHLYTLGVLFDYLEDNQYAALSHITNLKIFHDHRYLLLDESTQRNLELVRDMNGGSYHSLFATLHHCVTPMGGRLLREWILAPLRDITETQMRQNKTKFFVDAQPMLNQTRKNLSGVLDIERLSSRLSMGKAHPRDMYNLALSVKNALEIQSELSAVQNIWHKISAEQIHELTEFFTTILSSLQEDVSVNDTEGNIFVTGYHPDIDAQRDLLQHGEEFIRKLVEEEKKKVKISSLRIKHNHILGHFFEVALQQKDKMPSHFLLRQTTRTTLRYATESLLKLDMDIIHAQESVAKLEKELFFTLCARYHRLLPAFMQLGVLIAEIDVLQSFAWAATIYLYRRPQLCEKPILQIVQGRHPAVETHMKDFVPNSLHLDPQEAMFALVTGPNMSGKSTFLRQVALIVLMAQIGSYVPAEKAVIGSVDRIYCRVGSSDNIARGESTFLTEMNETAHILRTATDRSLIIFDEVGRGTSTLDGLAIAWAICEYTLNVLKSRTLFATHYIELTQLSHPRLEFLSISAKRKGEQILFIRKVVKGITDSFYGIDVARLAGVPDMVINRSRQLHAQLYVSQHQKKEDPPSSEEVEKILRKLLSYSVEELTPLEALNFLAKLREEAEQLITHIK